MPASVDGDIRLSVGINTNSVRQDATKLAKSIQGIFANYSRDSKSANSQLMSLQHQMAKYAVELNKAQEQQRKLASQKLPTDEYVRTEETVNKLNIQIDNLISKQNRMIEVTKATGGDLEKLSQSKAYQNLSLQIEEANNSLDKYKKKLEVLKSQGMATAISGVDTSQYTEATNKVNQLQNKLAELQARYNQVGKSSVKSGTNLTNSFKSAFKGIGNVYQKLKQLKGNTSNTFNDMAKSAKKGFMTILKYAFSIRSIFILFKRLKTYTKDAFDTMSNSVPQVRDELNSLKTSFGQVKNSLATAFQPIFSYAVPALNALAGALVTAMNALANFFATFTGQKVIYKAAKANTDLAKSYGGAGGSAKDAAEDIAEYDKLIVINQDKASGGGGGGGASDVGEGLFEEVPAQASKLAEMIKEAWKTADFTDVGALIGEKLVGAMEGINWNKYKKTGKKIGKSVATFLNGVFETPNLFSDVGKTIAEAFNTVVGTLGSFASNFHWESLGSGMAESVNSFFKTFDFPQLAQTIHDTIVGVLTTVGTFFRETDFKEIGTKLGEFINDLDLPDILSTLGQTIHDAIVGAIDLAIGFFSSVDFEEVGESIADFIEAIDFTDLIGNFLYLTEEIIKAIVNTIKGLWNNGDALTRVGLALAGLIGLAKISGITLNLANATITATGTSTAGATLGGLIANACQKWFGTNPLTVAVSVIVAWNLGESIGKQLGNEIFSAISGEDLTQYYKDFHWFGAGGFFDEISDDWEITREAWIDMVDDLSNYLEDSSFYKFFHKKGGKKISHFDHEKDEGYSGSSGKLDGNIDLDGTTDNLNRFTKTVDKSSKQITKNVDTTTKSVNKDMVSQSVSYKKGETSVSSMSNTAKTEFSNIDKYAKQYIQFQQGETNISSLDNKSKTAFTAINSYLAETGMSVDEFARIYGIDMDNTSNNTKIAETNIKTSTTGISGQFASARTNILGSMQKINTDVTSNFNQAQQNGTSATNTLKTNANSSLTSMASVVKTPLNTFANNVLSYFNTASNNGNTQSNNLKNFAVTNLNAMASGSTSPLQSLLNNVKNYTANASNTANTNTKGIPSNVGGNLKGMANQSVSPLNSFLGTVQHYMGVTTNTVTSQGGAWQSTGINLVNGLSRGLENQWSGGLLSTVTRLAKNLTSKLKQVFNIGSPSKLWDREIGQMLVAGLDRGIESKEQQVIRTISNMGIGMNNALQDSLSSDIQLPDIVQGKVIPTAMSYSIQAKNEQNDTSVRDIIREELSNLNINMPERLTVELSDGKTIAEVVWDEEEKRYKQYGYA